MNIHAMITGTLHQTHQFELKVERGVLAPGWLFQPKNAFHTRCFSYSSTNSLAEIFELFNSLPESH